MSRVFHFVWVIGVALVVLAGCGSAGIQGGRFPALEQDLPLVAIDLQKLINETPDGGVVAVPFGRYLLPRPLAIVGRNRLHVAFAPGSQLRVSDTDQSVITIERCSRVKVSGVRARHSQPLATYECHGPVLWVKDSDNIRIENCELNGCGAIGVSAWGAKSLRIANCHIHHNTFTALYLSDCDGVLLSANVIEDNANLLESYTSNNISWSDNLIRNNGGYWRKTRPPGLRATTQPDLRPWSSTDEFNAE